MWSTGGELTNLFQNHEVVAAMGWPLKTVNSSKKNFPVGETIPKENTTGLDRSPDDHRGAAKTKNWRTDFSST